MNLTSLLESETSLNEKRIEEINKLLLVVVVTGE